MTPLRVCTAWRGRGECLACDGRENAFFAGLSPDVIAGMHVEVNNCATGGEVELYSPQIRPEYVWVLRTGAVKLLASAWDGTQRIVRVLKAGDVAGLEALLSGALRIPQWQSAVCTPAVYLWRPSKRFASNTLGFSGI